MSKVVVVLEFVILREQILHRNICPMVVIAMKIAAKSPQPKQIQPGMVVEQVIDADEQSQCPRVSPNDERLSYLELRRWQRSVGCAVIGRDDYR